MNAQRNFKTVGNSPANNLIRIFCLAVVFGVMLTLPAKSNAQAPLFFDAFLADNGGQPTDNFNLFFLWNVTDGSVDLVGGNVAGADETPLGRFVDLGGSTGDPGAFATRTSLPFLPNTTYRITFQYASTDRKINRATVTIGSHVFPITARLGKFQTFSRTFSFNELTTANIVFQDLGNDNSGVGIDRVMLTTEPLNPPNEKETKEFGGSRYQ